MTIGILRQRSRVRREGVRCALLVDGLHSELVRLALLQPVDVRLESFSSRIKIKDKRSKIIDQRSKINLHRV